MTDGAVRDTGGGSTEPRLTLYKYTARIPLKSTGQIATVCDETVKLEKSFEKPLDYLKNGHIINLALGDKEC